MMRASSSLSFTRVSGTSTTKPSATIGSGSGGATIVRITEHLVLGVIRFLSSRRNSTFNSSINPLIIRSSMFTNAMGRILNNTYRVVGNIRGAIRSNMYTGNITSSN